jgi:hypothetical protein
MKATWPVSPLLADADRRATNVVVARPIFLDVPLLESDNALTAKEA